MVTWALLRQVSIICHVHDASDVILWVAYSVFGYMYICLQDVCRKQKKLFSADVAQITSDFTWKSLRMRKQSVPGCFFPSQHN